MAILQLSPPFLKATPAALSDEKPYLINGEETSKAAFEELSSILIKGMGTHITPVFEDRNLSKDEIYSFFDEGANGLLREDDIAHFREVKYPFFKDQAHFTHLKNLLLKHGFNLQYEVEKPPWFPRHFKDFKFYISTMESHPRFALDALKNIKHDHQLGGKREFEASIKLLVEKCPKLMGDKAFALELIPLMKGAFKKQKVMEFFSPALRQDPEIIEALIKIRPGRNYIKNYSDANVEFAPDLKARDQDPGSILPFFYFGSNLSIGMGINQRIPSLSLGANIEVGNRDFGLNAFYHYLDGAADRTEKKGLHYFGLEPRFNYFSRTGGFSEGPGPWEKGLAGLFLAQVGIPIGVKPSITSKKAELFCGTSLSLYTGYFTYGWGWGHSIMGISTKFLLTPFAENKDLTAIILADFADPLTFFGGFPY